MAVDRSRLLVTTAELQGDLSLAMEKVPELREQASHALELLRETCIFVQPFWKDTLRRSGCLAMVIGVCTMWRAYFHGAKMEDIMCDQWRLYDIDEEIASMQQKLTMSGHSRQALFVKLDEMGKSLAFLHQLAAYQSPSRIRSALCGTCAILEDTFTHIEAYQNIEANW